MSGVQSEATMQSGAMRWGHHPLAGESGAK
jgi:hypothetical protein